MDPVSQAALGAIAARVAAPRTLTGPILLVGAIAGAMPDIDVVFSPGGDFFDVVRTHRGITHSLFFAFTAGPLLGYLIATWLNRRRLNRRSLNRESPDASAYHTIGWMMAVTAAVLSHPLLDVLTPYGTQLLQPFSDARFAIHAMPIIDPLYTGLLLIGIWFCKRSSAAQHTAMITLAISSAYLALGWQLGVQAREFARDDLEARGVAVTRIDAFPTLLQPWQRQVVAMSPEADYLGTMSMWSPCAPVWTQGSSLRGPAVEALRESGEGIVFDWFAMGWVHYSLRNSLTEGDSGKMLVATDLRYALDGDPGQSVFAIAVPLTRDSGMTREQAGGAESAEAESHQPVPFESWRLAGRAAPWGNRVADPERLTAALANVFDPVCSDPAAAIRRLPEIAERQSGGRLDALHGEG